MPKSKKWLLLSSYCTCLYWALTFLQCQCRAAAVRGTQENFHNGQVPHVYDESPCRDFPSFPEAGSGAEQNLRRCILAKASRRTSETVKGRE